VFSAGAGPKGLGNLDVMSRQLVAPAAKLSAL
jgi:hypothetical protein